MGNSIVSGIQEIWKILFSWFIVILVLPVLISFYIYKQSVVLFSKILYTGLVIVEGCESHLVIDKIAENDKVTKDNSLNVLTNIGLYTDIGEGNLDLNELIQKVQKTVIDPDRISKWRLKSRLFRFGGYTFWKPNPDFNILNQVKKVYLSPKEDFLDYLNNWMIEPYDHRASPWGVLALNTGSSEYLAIKIHHCLGDGIVLQEFYNVIFDADYLPQVEQLFKKSSKGMGFLSMLDTIIKAPAILLEVMSRVNKTPDSFQPTKGIDVDQFTSTQALDFHALKSISKKQGVNFMTVLLQIYGAALGRYFASTGKQTPEYLCIATPQPWPGRPKKFIGNHWNLMNAYIPLQNTTSLESLHQIHANMSEYYSSKTFIVTKYLLCSLWTLFPAWIVEAGVKAGRNRYSLSCMLGSNGTYDGRRVKSIHPLGGLMFPIFGIFSVTSTLNDKLHWTFVGAKDLFKSKENLELMTKTYIVSEFEQLLEESNN